MHTYKHSQLAAACIICQRKQERKAPLWPRVLATITGYSLEDLKTVAAAVWKCVRRDEKPVLESNRNFANQAVATDRGLDMGDEGKENEVEGKRPLNVFELYIDI